MFKITLVAFLALFFACNNTGSIVEFVDRNDSLNVAKWLKNGGDPNYLLSDGSSLLHLATGPHGGNQVMELLVKAGAQINKGHGKYTPLMNAARWTNYEAVVFLFQNGADPNLTNEKGLTALDEIGVCKCDDEIKIKNLLSSVPKQADSQY